MCRTHQRERGTRYPFKAMPCHRPCDTLHSKALKRRRGCMTQVPGSSGQRRDQRLFRDVLLALHPVSSASGKRGVVTQPIRWSRRTPDDPTIKPSPLAGWRPNAEETDSVALPDVPSGDSCNGRLAWTCWELDPAECSGHLRPLSFQGLKQLRGHWKSTSVTSPYVRPLRISPRQSPPQSSLRH